MANRIRSRRRILQDVGIGIILGVTLGLVLAALGYVPSTAQASHPFTVQDIAAAGGTINLPLTDHSSSSDVLTLMKQSYRHWKTFSGEATTIQRNDQTGKEVSFVEHINIEQPGKVHLEVGRSNSALSQAFVSDGNTISQENLDRNLYTQYKMPFDAQSLNRWGPPAAPGGASSFVVPHPMEGVIPSSLGGYIYSVGLGQSMRPEEVSVIGEDIVAGHKTVVILWQVQDSDTLYKKHHYWIDVETGLILKTEIYGNSKGTWDSWSEQTTFVTAEYDQVLHAETFAFHPNANSKRLSLEEFDLNSGQ